VTFYSWTAVGAGAAMGAWLRWRLGILLNSVFPTIPFGTLTSNLLAGFLIGISVEVFAQSTDLPPEARLLVITGLLGGLSTFSTFSAEIVELLEAKEYWWGLAAVSAHLFGSLALTVSGIVLARFLFSMEAA
jgi:CrcB protein